MGAAISIAPIIPEVAEWVLITLLSLWKPLWLNPSDMGWPDLLSKRWGRRWYGDEHDEDDEDNLYESTNLTRSIPDANATALDPPVFQGISLSTTIKTSLYSKMW